MCTGYRLRRLWRSWATWQSPLPVRGRDGSDVLRGVDCLTGSGGCQAAEILRVAVAGRLRSGLTQEICVRVCWLLAALTCKLVDCG